MEAQTLPASASASVGARLSGAAALAALGVVFGDIGTSPLYTLKTCFTTAHVTAAAPNVLGIISALVWTLVLVVCVKYVTFVMRVDYRGEGGIFALLARVLPSTQKSLYPPLGILTIVGIVGGATLFGDGIITPAISVLSAVEGLGVVAPGATRWEVPITVAVLLALFVIQWRGTEKVGFIFGPVMVLWFAAIALSGLLALAAHPQVLIALNPFYGAGFLVHHGIFGFLVLGATILCVTGVEALYADMSHFGRGPVTLTWYAIVFPSLLLNYFGQGAAVLGDPKALDNAFYALTPGWSLMPMIVLATLATVIASQALISGAFTLIEQAIALNLAPRMRIVHTSNRYPGQVYVPAINALLGIGCVALVVTFKTSDALAAAYGLAVALTMCATTILYFVVIRHVIGWNRWVADGVAGFFILMDASFVLAGLAKLPVGGWIPLAIAVVLTVLATTWYEGKRRVVRSMAALAVPIDQFLAQVAAVPPRLINGAVVFLTGDPEGIPYILQHQWLRLQALHERVILLTLLPSRVPYVKTSERVTVKAVNDVIVRVKGSFGFMERPTLAAIVEACAAHGLGIEDADTSFVVAAPQLVRDPVGGLGGPRRWLFDVMQRLGGSLTRDLGIPPQQLVALGVEIKI